MKNIYILIISLLLSLSFALFLYLDEYSVFSSGRMAWLHKDKEIKSRLLAIPILLYHNIDGKGPFSIDAKTLREHFQLIRDRGIRVIPLHELIQRLEHPVPYRDKVIVITFDDGYGSLYTKLLPLAREFGYPVTLFVYSDNISLKSTKNLTWDRIRYMDRMGIDIQAHSISHADLTQLSKKNDPASRKRLFEEIYLSKRILELYIGKKVDFYAFPYGRYDLNTIDLTQKSGYRRVFSTDYGSNIITRDNFCLRRQHIKSSYSLNYIDNLIR
jgi:peptidoglycan/xylan/chitin deacetylase (PgdA/CDA1 family)